MKKFAVGNQKLKKSFLLWVLLCLVPNAASATTRRTWYFEQLAQSPEPSELGKTRHQAGFHLVSYPEAFSARFGATLDLGAVEVTAHFSQRVFLSATSSGTDLRDALSNEHRNWGMELARYRANPQGGYGRLALGVLPFSPHDTLYWKISLSTGLLPSPEVPWELRLNSAIFISNNRRYDFAIISGEVGRHFVLNAGQKIQVGGSCTWGQVLRSVVPGENTLLSLSPVVALHSQSGKWALSMPVRIWLDYNPAGGFLSDFATPAFTFSWQRFF